MSKLVESFVTAAASGRRAACQRGALKTWQQIQGQAKLLAETISGLGFQIQRAEQIKEKHLRAAFEKLKENHTLGTLQNVARSARYVLQGVEKSKILEVLTNKELGIDGRSRDGTKTRITDDRLAAARAGINNMRDHQRADRLDAIVGLAQHLGLRLNEALVAGRSLNAWKESIRREGSVFVRDGTKGGRDRTVFIHPSARAAALRAVEQAARLASGSDEKLWTHGKDLKSSLRSLSASLNKIGLSKEMSFHSLRYRFAAEQYKGYVEAGFTHKGALAEVSKDLGHGDGRGRYVAQVYLK